jgi:hypothetical protein
MTRLLLGLMLSLFIASAATAEDLRNVNVVNTTGYGIKFLGFNNPRDNDWSDNELGGELANGASVYVKFNTADEGCVWNSLIEWADPGYPSVIWHDVNLCTSSAQNQRTAAFVQRLRELGWIEGYL